MLEEEGGYSQEDGRDDGYGRGMSYARGRGGYNRGGRNTRRDSRGRYSRDDGRSAMMEHLEMVSATVRQHPLGTSMIASAWMLNKSPTAAGVTMAVALFRGSPGDCPSAAYIVQPPTPVNFPTNCCGQFAGWGGNGCGGCGVKASRTARALAF